MRSGVGPGARGNTRVGVTHPAQKRPRVDIFNFQNYISIFEKVNI